MFDGAKKQWVIRQASWPVPEIWGHLRRAEQGRFLANKRDWLRRVGIERADQRCHAPDSADGVKWLGYLPRARIL
jgi:hypothetical protein